MPYRTADDHINGAVLNFVDISSRLLTESRLHFGEERLKLLADSLLDTAIFTLDGDGNFSSWSGGAERLFGHTEREISGRPFGKIFTSADRELGIPVEEMQQASEPGYSFADRWMCRKDGTKFFASGTLAQLRVGTELGYGMVVRDISDRHQKEGSGIIAREEAEQSARLKDEFLAVLSHELKHPLNLIHVNAQLLLSLPQTRSIPAVAKAGETIERSVAAQVRIIDDLLDLSRTHAGKLIVDLAAVDLAQALAPSLKGAEDQAQAKGVALTHEGFDQALIVSADVVRIEQVIWNLLSNAIKFTSAGGTIRVRLAAEDEHAVLEVSDNGRGISPAFLPHVFDMFKQEDVLTTRTQGGMGIGLGLVKALVALQGGEVSRRFRRARARSDVQGQASPSPGN